MSDSLKNDCRYDVFLSYNSKDKDAFRKLKLRLESDGLKVWFDERELRSGDELHKAIAEGLVKSRVCAVFIGSEGFGPWHDWEIGIAVNIYVNSPVFRLIPVILLRESKSKFLRSEVPLWLRVEFPRLDDDE